MQPGEVRRLTVAVVLTRAKNMTNGEKHVSEEFPELFHYTNLCAFENIYKTKQLWATHYQNLNDTMEFSQFLVHLRLFIRPTMRAILVKEMQSNARLAAGVDAYGGIDAAVDSEVADFLTRVHDRTFDKEFYKETFIFSFCAHVPSSYEAANGLLSQWRGYGAGGGIAIVLDTYAIEQMMDYDQRHLSQLQWYMLCTVEYDSGDEESNMRIRRKFKKVFEFLPEIVEKSYPSNNIVDEAALKSLYGETHDDFLGGSTRVKHHAFHEENEVRIVISPKTNDSANRFDPRDRRRRKEILYRQGRGGEARYIELFGNARLPVKRVIVGPSRIQNVNCQTVKKIVKGSVEVVPSEIPFIW